MLQGSKYLHGLLRLDLYISHHCAVQRARRAVARKPHRRQQRPSRIVVYFTVWGKKIALLLTETNRKRKNV